MRSALAVACAVVLLTACSAREQTSLDAAAARQPSPSRSAPPRCQADGYVWQSVGQRSVLVGLSDAEEIRIPAHGSARPPVPRLIRPMSARISRAAVEAGVRPADALASLEWKMSVSLVPVGTRLTLAEPGVHETSTMVNDSDTARRGRFVEAVGVRLVTAKFSARCKAGTVRGTVTTWMNGRSSESLRCGLRKGLPALGREAERRACGTPAPSSVPEGGADRN
ncbi:hypothetical protein [Streptomyces sp. NPDC127038]|uniref:hypothetical protein n=1 Tax=Streptomyces sp. NPDC127038 TaxID=3347114 RepID=UPI0036481A09